MPEIKRIDFDQFRRLLILACCGGDKTKLGASNFRKLMQHMGIREGGGDEDFDSGRDDDY